MAASITINGVPGPLLTANAGDTITVNDVGGTATTWAWALASIPPGSTAVLLAPTAQTTTFVVDVEGTYLVQLIVDDTLPTESFATTIVAIPSQTSAQRVPAVGETVESGVRGWDTGAGSYLRLLDTRLENPGIVAGVATGSLSQGTVVAIGQDPVDPVGSQSAAQILGAYPGARTLPLLYSGASIAAADLVGFAFTTPSGGGSAVANDVVLVRTSGIYSGFTLGSWASADDYPYLYLTTAGAVVDVMPASASGAPPRIVGKVVRWYGAVRASACDIEVYGNRRAQMHQLEFGVGATWTATTAVYPGMTGTAVAASGGIAPGRYPAKTQRNDWQLAGIRVWAQTAGTGSVLLQVVRADTLATIGGTLLWTFGTNGATSAQSGVIPANVPITVQMTLASGTSPGQLSVAIDLWEP